MTPDVQLALPARREHRYRPPRVRRVRRCVRTGRAEPLGFRLAVTEACTNVVVHAYPDGREGPMEVTATLTDDTLTVVVRDEGHGMGLRPDSPGLGLGLPLIASLAETVRLGRDGEEHGGAHDVLVDVLAPTRRRRRERRTSHRRRLAGPCGGPPRTLRVAELAAGPLAGPVLCRVVSMALAQTHCPLEERGRDVDLRRTERARAGPGERREGRVRGEPAEP